MQEYAKQGNITLKCPYCKAMSAFSCMFNAVGTFQDKHYPINVWKCHYCDRGIFIKDRTTMDYYEAQKSLDIEVIFPSNEPEVNDKVPAGISNDYIESAKCFNIAAYKASVVMARRAIQKMCLNLGADKTKKLYQQIEDLKNNGKLHSDLADIATEVRFLGNDGAHPEDDGLDEVSKEDAEEILGFTLELLDDLYVRPEKVREMRQRREAKKAPQQVV